METGRRSHVRPLVTWTAISIPKARHRISSATLHLRHGTRPPGGHPVRQHTTHAPGLPSAAVHLHSCKCAAPPPEPGCRCRRTAAAAAQPPPGRLLPQRFVARIERDPRPVREILGRQDRGSRIEAGGVGTAPNLGIILQREQQDIWARIGLGKLLSGLHLAYLVVVIQLP